MNKQPHDSGIDYLEQAEHLIRRKGKAYNICSGCLHTTEICACANDCWAKKTIKGRLRHNKGYPYGTQPTFRPEMVKAVGKRSRLLIALNFMGDVGGLWWWYDTQGLTVPIDFPPHIKLEFPDRHKYRPFEIASEMVRFALLNPDHIILLLTKRPEWYGLVEWPENVWCGFTATNNEELEKRIVEIDKALNRGDGTDWSHVWISHEPRFGGPPSYVLPDVWHVIGGLSGPHARPVSEATLEWLKDKSVKAKRFAKANILDCCNRELLMYRFPREYPDSWRVQEAK